MQTFMQSLESSIGDYRQLLYDATKSNAFYYSFLMMISKMMMWTFHMVMSLLV